MIIKSQFGRNTSDTHAHTSEWKRLGKAFYMCSLRLFIYSFFFVSLLSRYVEREDEFDIIPLDTVKRPLVDDVVVDIVSLDPVTDSDSILMPVIDELTTLPTTVLSDQETNTAYQMRRQQWMREEEEKRNQIKREIEDTNMENEVKQETQTTITPTPTTTTTVVPMETNSLKRSFDESAQMNGESEEEKNKRVKV